MENKIGIKEAAEKIGVTAQTLRNWDNADKLPAKRTAGGRRYYSDGDILKGQELSKTCTSTEETTDSRDYFYGAFLAVLEYVEERHDKDTPCYFENYERYSKKPYLTAMGTLQELTTRFKLDEAEKNLIGDCLEDMADEWQDDNIPLGYMWLKSYYLTRRKIRA